MKRRIAAAGLVLAAALAIAGTAAQPRSPRPIRGAFFTNWSRYARGYTVKQIPADRLNLIDYAFAFSTPTGCALSDVWSDYQAPTWSGDRQRRRRR